MDRRSTGGGDGQTVRLSVSVPQKQYMELQQIAAEKRVSLAWVVRDAVLQYLSARTPLFPANEAEIRQGDQV